MTESGPLLCRAIFVKIIICQANCLEKKNMQSATFSKRKLEHFSDWVLLKWINANSWSLNHQLQKNQTQALSIIKKNILNKQTEATNQTNRLPPMIDWLPSWLTKQDKTLPRTALGSGADSANAPKLLPQSQAGRSGPGPPRTQAEEQG